MAKNRFTENFLRELIFVRQKIALTMIIFDGLYAVEIRKIEVKRLGDNGF
jgi:hypothetical protein